MMGDSCVVCKVKKIKNLIRAKKTSSLTMSIISRAQGSGTHATGSGTRFERNRFVFQDPERKPGPEQTASIFHKPEPDAIIFEKPDS
uniref:Uncharacterized protein n=1 Tax=Romanomermis culicivorax TaxID=13658 RepID=A0A915J007_ROMCU